MEMENKIPSFSKYVNTKDIIDLFKFIIELAKKKGIDVKKIEDFISEDTITPSASINHGAYDTDTEVQILYYNIPRIFENLLAALEKPIEEIQSGTLIKNEDLNAFIPAYLESKETELDAVLPNYDFGNMEMVPDQYAGVFNIITESGKSFSTTIRDLPVGSRILLNIKNKPTRFIIVHHGIPYKHKAEEEWRVYDHYPRYDNTVKGTWLLMEDIWEENTSDYKKSFHLNPNWDSDSEAAHSFGNYAVKNPIHDKYLTGE